MSENIKNLGSKSLEFEEILKKLSLKCVCEESKKLSLNLLQENDFNLASLLLEETNSAFNFFIRFGSPPLANIKNIKFFIKKVKSSANLTPRELLDIKLVLSAVNDVKKYSKNDFCFCESLSSNFSSLICNNELKKKIELCIISENEISDLASIELLKVRREKKRISLRIRDILEGIIKSSCYKKILQEPVITIRSSRFVIPIKSEFKSEIEGFVHDSSSSGATLFIEPKQVLIANNEIAILKREEEREIEKILSRLSQQVCDFSCELLLNYKMLIKIDMIFARAKLACEMKANLQKLNNTGVIALKEARHPLIDEKKVVPIDIEIGKDFDCLIITGPNTGGKTVSIKLVGIFVLMSKVGLMIPAKEDSEVCIFDRLLVDIGDEQSIEQSLSTFSGHISKLVKIIELSSGSSLVLIDEIGAGTDPEQGAALALSIIKYLMKKGSKLLVTTHYALLKEYAFSSQRVENACCEFDTKSLMSTYKLILGIPGRSSAFEIAKRLGVSEDIISKAHEFVSLENKQLDLVFKSLEESKRRAAVKERKLSDLTKQSIEVKTQVFEEKNKLEKEKEMFLRSAKEKSREIIENARRQAKDFLLELKKAKDFYDFSKCKFEIKKNIKRLDSESFIEEEKKKHKIPEKLKVGDSVFIVDLGREAEVLNVDGDAIEVETGNMKMRVDISRLELLNKKIKKKKEKIVTKALIRNSPFVGKREIDLRGYYVLDAIEELDRFIASMLLFSRDELTVIHGKGTGALAKGVFNFLKSHPNVKDFRLGRFGEGGIGVTKVYLK
ncbi:MAG: endonuclease MutS2 [Oscillospiraceae bacterium]|jgi:DNA mismatch repair protein MutS2|nr:endonuclease MutS2 [Oscillospiraceae bacterium]